tara:strand:+ start:149 stop:541 length:393 start_codon:yes stop_codon:yes gene_type:complete
MIKEKKKSNSVDSKKRPAMPKEKDINDLGVVSSRLLIYRILPRQVSKGGIIVPVEALNSNEVEYPHFGVVMCAGRDIQDLYDYGDFVYYNQFAGRYVVDHDSEIEYILIDENDVLMVNKNFDGYKDGFLT